MAIDPVNPTVAETANATSVAKDRFLAISFLLNSDHQRYGALMRDIENEHTRGTNTYPQTLTGAYDYLVNYKPARVSNNDANDGGLAFYNDSNDDWVPVTGRRPRTRRTRRCRQRASRRGTRRSGGRRRTVPVG
jgi:hypothetical protein